MSETEQIKEALLRKAPPVSPITNAELLSTGCTTLNLALTGRPNGGLAMGHYYWFVGDSSSGKTFFVLTMLAEAARSKRFADYKFIYNKPEEGALMDFRTFFGDAMADRVELCKTPTVDAFLYHASDAVKEGPCIYILDSADSLTSEQEQEKFKKRKEAYKKGPAAYAKLTGEMTDGKAKKYSSGIRQLLDSIQKTKSILIIISQTRDNMDAMSFETKKASGGRALRFYATAEIWTSVTGKHKKTVRGNDLQTGIAVRCQVKKNRLTGKDWWVDTSLYWAYGIDDIGSCIDYLVKWKHWTKAEGGNITAPDMELSGKKETIVTKIEADNREKELRGIVAEVWREIEASLITERKPRYN